jgi:hypothetical protein
MTATEKKVSAAYVSWGTFKKALEQLSQGVPPNRIDRTVFPGIAWAVQNQLFTALRFLGFIDSTNKPTDQLGAYATLEEEDARKAFLQAILESQYSALFALDLKKTTPGELAQKMGESYGVGGDTKEKAVRFFLSASDYVGVELSPLFEMGKKTGNANTTAQSRGRRRIARAVRVTPISPEPATNGGTSRTVTLASGGTLTISASLDLFALSADDRKFVFQLIDQLESYEKSHVTTASTD